MGRELYQRNGEIMKPIIEWSTTVLWIFLVLQILTTICNWYITYYAGVHHNGYFLIFGIILLTISILSVVVCVEILMDRYS